MYYCVRVHMMYVWAGMWRSEGNFVEPVLSSVKLVLQAHSTNEPLHQPELGLCYGRLIQWWYSGLRLWGLSARQWSTCLMCVTEAQIQSPGLQNITKKKHQPDGGGAHL